MTTESLEDATSPTSRPQSTLLTFLIADVRGYTRYTVEHGDEAAARLANRFAELCESVIGQHNGQVIELRGDEALAVFVSARDALRGAVDLQRVFRLAVVEDPSLPLAVGMGLDAGEPIPVRGGYRGGALNLAARLCSIAGATEILASGTVTALARKTDGLDFVDRGEVALKGMTTRVQVFQIAPAGQLAVELPPLQPSLVSYPSNLPDDPTPFIGREEEVATSQSSCAIATSAWSRSPDRQGPERPDSRCRWAPFSSTTSRMGSSLSRWALLPISISFRPL